MQTSVAATPEVISDELIRQVCARLSENRRVRRTLPGQGRLHIDRPLPFLCVYRRPTDRPDAGTERLVLGQGSYLISCGEEALQESLNSLVEGIVRTLADQFGAFLILELWSTDESPKTQGPRPKAQGPKPTFRIVTPKTETVPTTVRALADALESMELPGPAIEVEVIDGGKSAPPGLPSLLTTTEASELGCLMIGLAVSPFYRDGESGKVYPLLLRAMHREISWALRKAFFDFVHVQTKHRPENYQMLGRRAVVRAVWKADRELARISRGFNLLLAVTPVNTEAAYAQFKQDQCGRAPVFHYRLLPIDPEALKRELYAIRLEPVEDPTLASLLRDKRSELDRQINLLEDRDTPRFLYGSLQLYGGVDDDLARQAESLLATFPTGPEEETEEASLDAAAFADLARAEIEQYQRRYPAMLAHVEVRDDIPGLMVARGDLLVGRRVRVARRRVEAALQHEVGTHILTYFNGRAQPLRQLCMGLPGYDALQEGLALLAEFMVGGLTRSRLRILAARVVAVDRLVRGASFVETFRELCDSHGFRQRTAFMTTMRVCRGGGFTKDAVYLRGLRDLLGYLKEGGALEPLYAGKFSLAHLPLIQELQWRETLRPTPLFPRYLDTPQARQRLERLRAGLCVLDLVERE
jgi:uncharacterized protein (TIGR02421 family)